MSEFCRQPNSVFKTRIAEAKGSRTQKQKKTKKEQTLTDKLVSPNCAIDGVDGVVWNPGEGAEVA